MAKLLLVLVSIICLMTCLTAPVLLFHGLEVERFKAILLAASIGWFVCAAVLAASRKG